MQTHAQVRINRAIAISMALAGILFPLYPTTTLAKPIVSLFGLAGFIVWCVGLILCGVGLWLKPNRVVIWLIPIYILSYSTMTLAFNFVSLTAMVFYLIIPLSALWTYYQHNRPANSRFNILWQWHHWLLILNLAMLMALIFRPNGAGMELFYYVYGVLFDGRVEPVTFLRFIYLASVIGLIVFDSKPNSTVTRICSIALMNHGLTFLLVALSQESVIWVSIPLLILPVFLLMEMSGEYGYERA